MFTLLFLLSAFVSGWISASVSQYQTVEAQPGEEVTLQCSNISKFDTQTFWSRLVNRTKINCVVVMFNYKGGNKLCGGYEREKFEMKSNMSSVFLNIRGVDSPDAGLYYCGFFIDGTPSLTPIHLKVNGKITVFFSLNSLCSVHSSLLILYNDFICCLKTTSCMQESVWFFLVILQNQDKCYLYFIKRQR